VDSLAWIDESHPRFPMKDHIPSIGGDERLFSPFFHHNSSPLTSRTWTHGFFGGEFFSKYKRLSVFKGF
jgi:hypothetical protein